MESRSDDRAPGDLEIQRPEDWYSVWVSWSPEGEHLGWYVNLQHPMRRTPVGFEAMDLMLDILVAPDLSWRWKDGEEFEEILHRRIFDADLARRVRQSALAVIADIEDGRSPFCEPWPDWQPDPQWTRPSLPTGWDTIQ